MEAFVTPAVRWPRAASSRARALCPPRARRALRARRASPLACAPPADADAALSPSADAHSAVSPSGFSLREAPVVSFDQLSERAERLSAVGAYAIRGEDGAVEYMGYSKNIAEKLTFHQRLRPHSCVSFQVYVPPLPPELVSPDMLESVLEYWVRETGAVPTGNTVDRALWENPNAVDRKSSQVPVRERTTPPRSRRASGPERTASSSTTFSDAFRATSSPNAGWSATDDDYVRVDVDPFDAFSASRKRTEPRAPWPGDDDEQREQADWVPILALMGVAGVIWLIGVLGNALPAATPSMGM